MGLHRPTIRFPIYMMDNRQVLPLTNFRMVADGVGTYNSFVANGCLTVNKSCCGPMGELWQRNYYGIITWDEIFYRNAKVYLTDNPIHGLVINFTPNDVVYSSMRSQ